MLSFRGGHEVKVVSVCGGLAQSDLFVQTNADVLGLQVVRPTQTECVLKGAAMLGAAAAAASTDRTMWQVIDEMQHSGESFTPDPQVGGFHRRKYRVFLEMVKDQQKYKMIMRDAYDATEEIRYIPVLLDDAYDACV